MLKLILQKNREANQAAKVGWGAAAASTEESPPQVSEAKDRRMLVVAPVPKSLSASLARVMAAKLASFSGSPFPLPSNTWILALRCFTALWPDEIPGSHRPLVVARPLTRHLPALLAFHEFVRTHYDPSVFRKEWTLVVRGAKNAAPSDPGAWQLALMAAETLEKYSTTDNLNAGGLLEDGSVSLSVSPKDQRKAKDEAIQACFLTPIPDSSLTPGATGANRTSTRWKEALRFLGSRLTVEPEVASSVLLQLLQQDRFASAYRRDLDGGSEHKSIASAGATTFFRVHWKVAIALAMSAHLSISTAGMFESQMTECLAHCSSARVRDNASTIVSLILKRTRPDNFTAKLKAMSANSSGDEEKALTEPKAVRGKVAPTLADAAGVSTSPKPLLPVQGSSARPQAAMDHQDSTVIVENQGAASSVMFDRKDLPKGCDAVHFW
jgi:hypothetical protein